MLILGAGCSADSILVPPADTGALYWELRVNYPAVRMSLTRPYDTLQLVAIPYDANDTPWNPLKGAEIDIGASVWSSRDSSKVHVSSSGLLTARAEAARVFVLVTKTIGPVTHTDSALVQVKDNPHPPKLKTFSIRPTDSLKRAMLTNDVLPVVALDENGDPIENLPVRYFSSDKRTVGIGGWNASYTIPVKRDAGEVWISATTWIYGVVKSDSFTMQTGWPFRIPGTGGAIVQTVDASGTVVYEVRGVPIDVGPGGFVGWENRSAFGPTNVKGKPPQPGIPMDVIFDDSTVALSMLDDARNTGGGHIRNIPSDTTLGAAQRVRYRRFLTPGKHAFTIQPVGIRGMVVVHDR